MYLSLVVFLFFLILISWEYFKRWMLLNFLRSIGHFFKCVFKKNNILVMISYKKFKKNNKNTQKNCKKISILWNFPLNVYKYNYWILRDAVKRKDYTKNKKWSIYTSQYFSKSRWYFQLNIYSLFFCWFIFVVFIIVLSFLKNIFLKQLNEINYN